jgi:hypothetical protein
MFSDIESYIYVYITYIGLTDLDHPSKALIH